MNSAVVTSVEVVGALVLEIVLIIAVYLILRYSKMPGTQSIPQNKFAMLLLSGLAMLGFLMLNMIAADILDPNRTFGLGVVAAIMGVNLPFIGLTIWQLIVSRRTA